LVTFAALRPQQVGDRLEGGGLAGAIRAKQQQLFVLPSSLERYALQHEDDVIVDHLDVVDR